MRRSRRQVVFGILGILVVLIMIAGVVLPSVLPSPPQAPIPGTGQSLSGTTQQRISDLRQFLQTNPNDKGALLDLGSLYLDSQQYSLAVDQFSKVLQLDPQNAEAHYELGLCYAHQNSWNAAITEYRKAISIDANKPQYHLGLGLALANSSPPDVQGAVAAWQTVKKLDPTGQYGAKADQLIRQY